MATYYWLGYTGETSGNVNNAANWTLWAPQGVCGFLPVAAATIPRENDTVIFTRYNVSGTTYNVSYFPQYPPLGTMSGYCGATQSQVQYFNRVDVLGDCPVSLGKEGTVFTFRTRELNMTTNSNNTALDNWPTSNISLQSSSGLTGKVDAVITITAKKPHNYKIKGYAQAIQTNPNITELTYAYIYLDKFELTRGATYGIVHNILAVQNNSPQTVQGNDVWNISSSVTGVNGMRVTKLGTTVNIDKGFAVNAPAEILVVKFGDINNGPYINFLETGYSGEKGDLEIARTYISRLGVAGNKSAPVVTIRHGTDIVKLDQYGGYVNFAQTPNTSDPTVVQSGLMNASTSKMSINDGSASFGANGDFILQNSFDNATSYTPDITLSGAWVLDLNPSGSTGV